MNKVTCNTKLIDEPGILIEVPKLAEKYQINITVVWGLFNNTPSCYLDKNRLDVLEQELKKIRG